MIVATYAPAVVVSVATMGRIVGLQGTLFAMIFVAALIVAVGVHLNHYRHRGRFHGRHS